MCCYNRIELPPTLQSVSDQLQQLPSLPAPPLHHCQVPQLGHHLDKRGLPHTCLPLNDHWHPTPCTLVDVQHLDHKIGREDIRRFVNNCQTPLLVERKTNGASQHQVKQLSLTKVTENKSIPTSSTERYPGNRNHKIFY